MKHVMEAGISGAGLLSVAALGVASCFPLSASAAYAPVFPSDVYIEITELREYEVCEDFPEWGRECWNEYEETPLPPIRNGGTYALDTSRVFDIRPVSIPPEGYREEDGEPSTAYAPFWYRIESDGTRTDLDFYGYESEVQLLPGTYEVDIYAYEWYAPHPAYFRRAIALLAGFAGVAEAYDALDFEGLEYVGTLRFTITDSSAPCCSSVVFIPGLEGSQLSLGGDELWPPTLFHVAEDMEKLRLNEDGTPSYPGVTVGGVVDTFYTASVYGGLSDFLDSLAGGSHPLIREWYPLAYDWRYSPETIVENGIETPEGSIDVVSKLEELAARSRTGKVTLVAHSMGGLVGKAVIKKLKEEGKDGIIDSFVMVGSPQLGTPQAVGGLLHGEGSDIAWHFITFVDKAAARRLGYDLPSAYSLLPSEAYFSAVLYPPVTFDGTTLLTSNWRSAWGLGLNAYSELTEFLTGQIAPRERPLPDDYRTPEVLRPELVAGARALHADFDRDDLIPPHVRVVQIAGWGLDTIKSVEYTERHGALSYEVETTVEGDGTVVYPSAVASGGGSNKFFFNLSAFNQLEDELDYEHINILNSEIVRNAIQDVLETGVIEEGPYFVSEKPQPGDFSAKLLVSSHSPVFLGVRDTAGRFTGIAPGQDPAQGVYFLSEEIPGSSFFAFGESQYALLPHGGSYAFEFVGNGTGATTIEVSRVSEGSPAQPLATFTDVPTTPQTVMTLVPEDASENVLAVDRDGDGEPDAYVAPDMPDATLSELVGALRERITALDIKPKLRENLLKRVANIEKKMQKTAQKNARVLANFEAKLAKLQAKARFAETSFAGITDILDALEAQSSTIPLDPALLADIRTNIVELRLQPKLTANLLVRIDRLAKVQALTRSVANMNAMIDRRAEKIGEDAGTLRDLLGEIENIISL